MNPMGAEDSAHMEGRDKGGPGLEHEAIAADCSAFPFDVAVLFVVSLFEHAAVA